MTCHKTTIASLMATGLYLEVTKGGGGLGLHLGPVEWGPAVCILRLVLRASWGFFVFEKTSQEHD